MNSCNSITRTTKELSEQWGGNVNIHLTKRNIQMANMHMEMCSTSLLIWEMQSKNPMT